MEIEKQNNSQTQQIQSQHEIYELMVDSVVMEKAQSKLTDDNQNNNGVPSIINNLQQKQHKSRISELLGSFSCELYQQQMKTIRTLGIITQQKSQISTFYEISNKQKQNINSIKSNTRIKIQTFNKSLNNNNVSFPSVSQSEVEQISVYFQQRQQSNLNISFILFRNHLFRNKIQIIEDSFCLLSARIKHKSNITTFLDSIKSKNDQNQAIIYLSYIPTLKQLKLGLLNQLKYKHEIKKFKQQFKWHSEILKQSLWQNNCIQLSHVDAIQLTINKQKQTIRSIKNLIKTKSKQNNQIQLQNNLVQILELRQLFFYQLSQKGIKSDLTNPLLLIQKSLLEQLHISTLYKQYYFKKEQKYQLKKKTIKQKYSLKEICSYLKINYYQQQDDEQFTYMSAVEELNNFLTNTYPHLQIYLIQKFYNIIELCQQNNRHTNISFQNNQSQKLGLVILCMIQSQLQNTYYKIRLIEHYLKLTDNTQYEPMCFNLILGLDYIQNSWQIM